MINVKKYRKKPIIVEAFQWEPGIEHDAVVQNENIEGKCSECARLLTDHAWIKTLEGMMRVCPGDYIVKGAYGEFYPVKENIFYSTYDSVDD